MFSFGEWLLTGTLAVCLMKPEHIIPLIQKTRKLIASGSQQVQQVQEKISQQLPTHNWENHLSDEEHAQKPTQDKHDEYTNT